MRGTGIPEVDALAWTEQGLAAFRVWTRRQALSRDATPEAVREYLQTTTRLLELDQHYWYTVAVSNTRLIEAQRRLLSANEREAITDRVLAPFRILYNEYLERIRPLITRLPAVLQNPEDAPGRRAWVLAVDNLLTDYTLGAVDAVEALREAARNGSAPPPGDAESAAPGEVDCPTI